MLFVIVLFLGCSAKIEKAPDNSKHIAPDKLIAVKQSALEMLNGIFLGVSKEKYGDLGWLICLDPAAQKGKLYMPPAQKGYGDLVYVLELSSSDRLLVGTITSLRLVGNFSKQLSKAAVSLEPLALQDVWSPSQAFSGVYSNVEYHAVSGDLAGAEVILIRKSEGAVGLITLFGGGPEGSYLLLETSLRGNHLKFAIRGIQGRELYSGVLSSSQLELKNETYPCLKKELLKRRSLDTIFGPDCKL
jgi:hypothetical protein